MTGALATTTKGGKHSCPISRSLVYTLLSRARRRDFIEILNFNEDKIKHNKEALKEMEHMRRDYPFVYEHPLEKLHVSKICLNNIRDWQAHFSHFLSGKYYAKYCSVLCFTETKVNGSRISNISEHQPGLENINHPTAPCGLAIYYNKSKVVIDAVNIPDETFTSHIELMSVLMSIEGEQALLVLIYQPPVANQREIRHFIEELTAQFDFNLDQMHDLYADFLHNILTCFGFTQHSNCSTHIYGGISDLVFHNRKQTQ